MKNFKLKKSVYIAIAALAFLILTNLHLIHLDAGQYSQFVNLIALILTGVGILVNPTSDAPALAAVEEEVSTMGQMSK